MARLLLRGNNLREALPTAAARLAQVLGLTSAAIEMEAWRATSAASRSRCAKAPAGWGRCWSARTRPRQSLRRLQERVVPALEALLSAALEREELLGGVVETASLRRADVVKTALLRAVSHDLRSPLTAISAAGEAVAAGALSEDERKEMAAVIQEETRRLSRLVDNLLDLVAAGGGRGRAAARVDLGRGGDRLGARGAEREGGGVRALDRPRSAARASRFGAAGARDRERAGERPPALRGAPGVGAGARGATHGGRGRSVIVRIVDRGPGIPPAQLERVFEPFYRAGTASGGHRGSGLGLAIARGFSEANGGTLHVESLPGQGATFVFELPLEPVVRPGRSRRRRGSSRVRPARPARPAVRPARPAVRPARPAVRPARPGSTVRRVLRGPRARPMWPASTMAADAPRVLVVDDEPQILRALKVVLREAGFEVIAAQTAAEALDLAAVRPPEAAIVDLVLPDGDGMELTRRLREWSEMPILVLSAVGEEEQKVSALEAGADDYITKPFGARELVARLQAALRRARADGGADDRGGGPGGRPRRARGAPRRRAVHLTPIEFELLRVLMRNSGRLMTHRALLAEVWGPGYADDMQPLRTHIARLRAKIEPEGPVPRYIVTDPGVGYRFAG